MIRLWQRLPIVARAIPAGLLVLFAGSIPWSGIAGYSCLAGWNLRVFVALPWAIAPMSVYLFLYWKFLGGSGWPRATGNTRRMCLRANPLPGEVWGMSMLAGLVGLAATQPLLHIISRLVSLPGEARPITVPSGMPPVTMFLLLVMASIVSGVVEEAAFRGYMQGPIERRHGPVVAILLSGAVFGLLHYNHHPSAVVTLLPYYIAISAVYGGLAATTNSILPGLALHAGGDVFSLAREWATGLPEWQTAPAPPALIWETGVDFAFVRSVLVFALLGGAAVLAYGATRRAVRAAGATGNPTRSE
jgi:membrane protease YdiL (CAAX protease family)